MERKVALLCDSSADVTEAEAKELGIHVLRMPVIIDGQEYLEGISVFDEDILAALRAQKKITTTQPSAGEIMKKWDELLQDHDEVFYLPLSRALSGTCANALRLAQERYEGKVTVVDSTFVCYPVIYMLKAAREMLEKGYTCAQIKEKIEKKGSSCHLDPGESQCAQERRTDLACRCSAGRHAEDPPAAESGERRDRCAGQGANGCQSLSCRHRVRAERCGSG